MTHPAHTTWASESARRLDALISRDRGASAPPLAVFDADGTLWADDIGEDCFLWLLEEKKIPGLDYSRDLFAEYQARVEEDEVAGYASLVELLAGVRESELRAWCRSFFEARYARKVFAAQQSLIDRLHGAGWEVWIVSASPRWMVEPGAEAMGIPLERVVGISSEVVDGVLSEKVQEPVSARQGKVACIETWIGRTPALVSGNSMGDFAMLKVASELSLVIEPGEELSALAEEAGWVVERWL